MFKSVYFGIIILLQQLDSQAVQESDSISHSTVAVTTDRVNTTQGYTSNQTDVVDAIVERKCQRLKKVTYSAAEAYPAICYVLVDKCSGWLRNKKCRKVPFGIPCTKTRYVLKTREEVEEICCPGYLPINGTDLCEIGCLPGFYGDQCQYTCDCPANSSPDCNITTGICTCNPGWTGVNCSQVCPDGTFGLHCQESCLCGINGVCHPADGTCNCTRPGWTGRYCREACAEGFYGYNCSERCTCNNNQICDYRTGACTCKVGWTGSECSQECSTGYYGQDCLKECLCRAEHTETCDSISGKCTCKPGRTGDTCEKVCEEGTYGSRCSSACSCGNSELCNPVNGQCISKCVCSINGTSNCVQGNQCLCEDIPEQQTDNAVKDANCKDGQRITNCMPDSDIFVCVCKPGWTGKSCGKVCPEMSYGVNCHHTCDCPQNESCNHVDGHCTERYAQTGILDEKTISALIIVGYVSLVVIPFVIVPLFLHCYKEKKGKSLRPGSSGSSDKKDSSSENQAKRHTADTPVGHSSLSAIERDQSMYTFQNSQRNGHPENIQLQSFKANYKPSLAEAGRVYSNDTQENGVYSNGQLQNSLQDSRHERENIYCNAEQKIPMHQDGGHYDVPSNGRPVDETHIYCNAEVDRTIYNLLQEACKTKIVNMESYPLDFYSENSPATYNKYDTLQCHNYRTDMISEDTFHHTNDLIGTYNTLHGVSPKPDNITDPPYDTLNSVDQEFY